MDKGFSHVGLATCDMDSTIDFYQGVLGFNCLGENQIAVLEGGHLRQVMFDIGGGQFVAFLEANQVPGIADEYDAGITSTLGVPNMFYHVAFSLETLDDVKVMRSSLLEKNIHVSPIVQHGPAMSIYLKDPNKIQLEFTAAIQDFDQEDQQGSFAISKVALDPVG